MSTLEQRYSLKVKEGIDACLKSHGLRGSKHENVVLMLSGGMDSVSLAWGLLEHTEQSVHIHAIHLDNSEGRFKAEESQESLTFIPQRYTRQFEITLWPHWTKKPKNITASISTCFVPKGGNS